ncbi:MAG TPA: GAF domain-containing sensor histidine kinase [Gemmatimonadales bacterium]|nr:GAF domain-containing sensor histidine kinase [Gemmatimonadales bacterium]
MKARPLPQSAKETLRLKETLRVEERFRRLLGLGVSIFSEHTTEAVLQRIVDGARDVVGARYAAIGVLAPDRKSLTTFVTSGIDAKLRERIGEPPHGRGLLGLLIRHAKPIRTADIARHPEQCGFPPHHPLMHSFLGVPIKLGQSVYGNLYLTDKIGAHEFNAEDEGIAVLLAAQAAVAIENARLMEESNRLISQVRDMQRQRDLFFAMMNHELRNALTGVYGWAERLVRPRTTDALAQAAREVYEGTERTISLLNNFLDLTRLDAGKVRPVWRDVDLREAVKRALTGFEPAAEAKRLVLSAEVVPNGPSLRTDPVRLQQILVNLVSNAVRHSPEGGCVQVGVRPNGSRVEFFVRDEGSGVPPEAVDRIFEPFERFEPHSGVGTGLGLPVSRRLAEVLGGQLSVKSVPGQGATFILELPLHPPK